MSSEVMRKPERTKKTSTPAVPYLKRLWRARTPGAECALSGWMEAEQRWWKKTSRAAMPRMPSSSRRWGREWGLGSVPIRQLDLFDHATLLTVFESGQQVLNNGHRCSCRSCKNADNYRLRLFDPW